MRRSSSERSRRFYTELLGGRVAFWGPAGLTYVARSKTWIIIDVGGGPTDDEPDDTLAPADDPNRVSSFLNTRVADIQAGHLIEVGQTTDPDGDWTPDQWSTATSAAASQ